LSYSGKVKASTGVLLAVDVFDLLRAYAAEHGLTEIDKDYNGWGALITADMRQKQDSLKTYDTILIDEGQDMQDSALEMLELHAREDTTICVATGAGQELYGKAGAWLQGFRARSTVRRLLRNFRNPRLMFQVAQVFYESRLKPGKIAATLQRFTD
jgi:hypothetical protein